MLSGMRTLPGLVLDAATSRHDSSAPTSPTDATSPVPSLSRSILSASDSSPNGWVTLELPQTTSPAHSPTPSSGREDSDGCATHVRFNSTCLVIPDTPIKSPGLAARMLGVGAWSTVKRRVSDPDRDHIAGARLGVRLPGLGRKAKHAPCEIAPCPPPVLRPCLVPRSSSQHTISHSPPAATSVAARPRLSTAHSTPHGASTSLPAVLVRPPTRSHSLPPPMSTATVPLRECCPDCVRACTELDGAVKWSAGARRKLKEDRAERERETRAGLRDPSSNSFGWEDMLAFEAPETETEDDVGPSSSSAYQRRNTSPPPSSLTRCAAVAAKALKHPHALPCPPPRVCTEDDTDEEGLFPLPVSPRGTRSPCSRSSGSKSPKGSGKATPNSNTPSPTIPSPGAMDMPIKCTDTPDPAKCAEVIAVKCAEKAKAEVVGPAVRRLLEVQQAFEGHRLSPVPGSEENTPRCGTPTTPLGFEAHQKSSADERAQSKFESALVDELPLAPPVSGSHVRPSARRRRSSSASSVGKAFGALVRGVSGVSSGPM